MPRSIDGNTLPLAVFLPDGGEGYVMRVEVARPKVARGGRVYTRRTVQPYAPTGAKWYIYSEPPIGKPSLERAHVLLRNYMTRGKKRHR